MVKEREKGLLLMTVDPLDLASLLCSRLCHDLLSPVGAMSNGLELLAEEQDADMRRQCMDLLEQSARTSTDKLRYFRLAFGSATGYDAAVPAEEPHGLVAALVAGNARIALAWNVGMAEMPKAAVKVLLNLALIGFDALLRGGTLEIGAEERDGACEIVVRASGPRIAFDQMVGSALEGTLAVADLSSRTAPAWMISQLAERGGGRLQVALNDDALVMGAVLPG